MGVLSGSTAPRVVVALGGADRRDDLVALALDLVGEDPAGVRVVHACPRCGSHEHGRPGLRRARGDLAVGLSLSRADDHLAVAVSPGGDVGIDLEAEDAAGFAAYDDVVLHPDEDSPATVEDRTRLWVRKEACLKLVGQGLVVDPRAISVDTGTTVDVAGTAVTLVDLADLGGGLVGAVAVAGARSPEVTVVRAAGEAPRP